EVVYMTWNELSSDRDGNPIWSLPGSRTKNGRPHTVPLSLQAMTVLNALPRLDMDKGFVFPGTSGENAVTSFCTTKRRLDAQVAELNGGEPIEDWCLHDLRRSLVTGMMELGIAPHYVEAVVNHVSGHKGGVAGVYNVARYVEPKREALNRWGRHIEKVV